MMKSKLVLTAKKRVRVASHVARTEDAPVSLENSVDVVSAKEQEGAMNMSAFIEKKTTPGFTYADFSYLSKNENNRYAANSSKVAHAVITRDTDGSKIATQYRLPEGDEPDTPVVCQITDIQEIEREGMIRYQARGFDGRKWYSKRSEHAEVRLEGDEAITAVDIAYFSEDDESDDGPFCGSHVAIQRFLSSHAESSAKIVKGGHDMVVDPVSVLQRDSDRNRIVSQNKIMGTSQKGKGKSARDVYEDFFCSMKETLSSDMLRILERAFSADIKISPENQYRPEWLHAYGFSLTPISENPQHRGNLGAAGKWVNTEMMILERIAKWFALNQNASTQITIKTLFEMLCSSDLIDRLHFEVNIEFQSRLFRFIQDLDAFKESPVFRKASDLAQATGISYSMLHAAAPLLRERVSIGRFEASASRYVCVPESFTPRVSIEPRQFTVTVIDLETTGLNPDRDTIIEAGALTFLCTEKEGVLSVIDQYSEFNDPGREISKKISKLTNITNEMLIGKAIDWAKVGAMIEKSDYIICHNSNFDRKFLERQTPLHIQALIRSKLFGCTMQDIDWQMKGHKNRKLKDLNLDLGFKYAGHRAINDCWATLNLLREVSGAVSELLGNIHKSKTLLCATGNTYEKRELLKQHNFQWSDGKIGNIPKCWFIYVSDDELEPMKTWLDEQIYGEVGRSDLLPQHRYITAVDRYSVRSDLARDVVSQTPRLFKRPVSEVELSESSTDAKRYRN